MYFHFRVSKEHGNWWADCIELVGLSITAMTRHELHYNCQSALNEYIDTWYDINGSILEIENRARRNRIKDSTIISVRLDDEWSI